MTVFERLKARLHAIFDKEPGDLPFIALSYAGPCCSVTIENRILTLKSYGGMWTFDLSSLTVGELTDAITATGSITATIDPALMDFKASALSDTVNQDIQAQPYLRYPQSLLWIELEAVAAELEEENRQLEAAKRQMTMATAEQGWLEEWLHEYFGVYRFQGESDDGYFNRAKYEIFSEKVNNKALVRLLSDALGYTVDVKDLGETPATFFYTNAPTSRLNTDNAESTIFNDAGFTPLLHAFFGVYIHSGNINDLPLNDKDAILSICGQYKAAGTRTKYFAPTALLIVNDPVKGYVNNAGYNAGPVSPDWAEVSV